jgi:hypothetical protein
MAFPSASFRQLICVGLLFGRAAAWAQNADPVNSQVQTLVEQNQRLQEQIRAQQNLIDGLTGRIDDILKASDQQGKALKSLQEKVENAAGDSAAAAPVRPAGEVRISAEAGLAFFKSGSAGQFPNSEFRVDDAKLFVEAPVWQNAYFYAGLDLVTREAFDEYFHVGELYLDFENVPVPAAPAHLLNVRVGRFYIPFGEEYEVRGVMENPLISHSVSDLWGIDEGVEIYGGAGKVDYALAVQNGGIKTLRDFNSDKAVAARLGFNPVSWLRLSASAMRTGDLTVAGDGTSALWFANGFIRELGAPATTQLFSASLGELDGSVHWKTGHLGADLGYVKFDDDDTTTNNARHMTYYAVEGVQNLGEGLYGAVRFSQIHAPRGYTLVGQGTFTEYYNATDLTDDLQRLSFGLGYRFGPPLVWKTEYNVEQGHLVSGQSRSGENFLSTEIALRF